MKKLLVLFLIFILGSSCSKEWLDERSNKGQTTPSNLDDLQQILNNADILNGINTGMSLVELLESGTDDHILSQYLYDILAPYQPDVFNAYIFAPDIFSGKTDMDVWNIPYQRVYIANVVLDKLKELTTQDMISYNRIKGEALFHRVNSFYWLSQTYMEAYDATNAKTKPGVPVRLVADPNAKTRRSTMEETYAQMIADAKESLQNCPVTATNPFHPSAAAAAGLLARIYLSMQDYPNALHYADTALEMKNELMDFNTLDTSAYNPIPQYNKEIIWSDVTPSTVFNPAFNTVDTLLFNTYASNDLRTYVYFKNRTDDLHAFNGNYSGSESLFAGIATDELWLIRAECEARQNEVNLAMSDLNHLLVNRFSMGTFIPLAALDAPDALRKV
ncbi:MAG: RagB/SusD family nutrient uptake outer membrane protein, partial [Flavitalea sp.]